MNRKEYITRRLQESILLKRVILEDQHILKTIENIVGVLVNVCCSKKNVFFCGNGGSASDAQHLAAELSGKYYIDRAPLSAEALHVNTSYLTAVANDYSYDEVYSRLIKAKAVSGDVLVAISTSGNSANILKALETANKIGVVTVGLTGKSGGGMKNLCKYLIRVPSSDTPRIQEAHITIGHIICDIVERELFGSEG